MNRLRDRRSHHDTPYAPQMSALSRDQLQLAAPSIFANRPWTAMSDRYKFIPTIEVVQMLAEEGFRPMQAMQSRSRIEGKSEFTKHLIRFRNDQFIDTLTGNVECPELVLTNSHDGTSSYKLMAGIFRLICTNGLIVRTADYGSVKLNHSGGNGFQQQVIDATYQVMDEAPQTMRKIETWKAIETTRPEREIFAAGVASLRENDTFPASSLLGRKRGEDRQDDVWTMMNVVQENTIKGGVRGQNRETGRRTTTREVRSVGENLRLNQAIWAMTEAFAQLKGA